MVGTQARRYKVAEILYYANDYIKMKTLAERLGVSYSTIRNDVDILSLTYNIIYSKDKYYREKIPDNPYLH